MACTLECEIGGGGAYIDLSGQEIMHLYFKLK
jgi:hypothetical protein